MVWLLLTNRSSDPYVENKGSTIGAGESLGCNKDEMYDTSLLMRSDDYLVEENKDGIEETLGKKRKRELLQLPSAKYELCDDSVLDSSFHIVELYGTNIANTKDVHHNPVLDLNNWLSDSEEEVPKESSKSALLAPAENSSRDMGTKKPSSDGNISKFNSKLASILPSDLSDPILSSSPSKPPSRRLASAPKPAKIIPSCRANENDTYSKKELKEANKVTRKKEELLSEMIMQIPSTLYEACFQKEHLKEIFIYPEIENTSTALPMISWMRKVKARYNSERDVFIPCSPTKRKEKNLVMYYKAKDFVNIVIDGTLQLMVNLCQTNYGEGQELPVIIIVEGYDQFLNKIRNMEETKYKKAVLAKLNPSDPLNDSGNKRAKKPTEEISLTPKEIDQLVNEAQLTTGVNIFPVKNNQDAINWLHSFTYTIAYALYDKFERNISLANLGTVRSGTDTKSTFLGTVKQFRLMSTPKVEKLYGYYPSIFALYSRFSTNNSLGKDNFDKNIIPPSTEKSMKKLFTSEDPNDIIHE